jgi:hypothetical protein
MASTGKAKLRRCGQTATKPARRGNGVQFKPPRCVTPANQTEGGRSRGRQRSQHTGSVHRAPLQLVFDSADETPGDATSAGGLGSEQTAMLEQFVVPSRDGSETRPW